MLFSAVFVLLSLAHLALAVPAAAFEPALAKRGAAEMSHSSQSSGGPSYHYVTVGKKKLRFDPEYIHAKKGDIVVFEFYPRNHTLTESSFAHPCTPLRTKRGTPAGLDSALHFATKSKDGSDQPIFGFTVWDDKHPIWFHSRQTKPVNECHKGMVFAINPNKKGKQTLDKLQKKAIGLGKKKGKE